jgi:Tfp pilus assembly protein PilO
MESISTAQLILFSLSAILSISIGVIGWFVSRIFDEINRSRQNERELYQQISKTREDMLNLHMTHLRELVSSVRDGIKAIERKAR